MIRTGLTGFYVAKYNYSGGQVSYTEGRVFLDAVSFQDEPQVSDNTSRFYTNNAAKYHSGGGKITSVNLTIGTDGLSQEAATYMLGVPVVIKTIGGQEVPVLAYGENIDPPYIAFGLIEVQESDAHATQYMPKIFLKAKCSPTGKTINTEGESREWQAETINATAVSDDTVDHDIWFEPQTPFTALAEADAFVRAFLNITDQATPPEQVTPPEQDPEG